MKDRPLVASDLGEALPWERLRRRIQQPGYNLKFGVYVEVDKAVPAPGVTFQFKRYKVTARE